MSSSPGSALPAWATREFQAEALPRVVRHEPECWPEGPVEIEIGAGGGLHPLARARQRPEIHLLAIEHTRERFGQFERLLEREGRPGNLKPLHANAISFIAHFVPRASVDRYWILYPNPYPKRSQHRRRWHYLPFAQRLIETLKPGGELVLATNIREYAEQANLVWQARGLTLRSMHRLSGVEGGFEPRTHFERKYLSRGESCFEVRLTRSGVTPSIS